MDFISIGCQRIGGRGRGRSCNGYVYGSKQQSTAAVSGDFATGDVCCGSAAHEFDRVRVSMEGVFRIIVAAIGLHLVCFTAIDIAGYVHVFQMDVVAIGAIGFDGLRYRWLLWLLCRSGHQHSINHAKTRVD